jgi:hypothetical protein
VAGVDVEPDRGRCDGRVVVGHGGRGRLVLWKERGTVAS